MEELNYRYASAPVVEPVTLTEAKNHLRVDTSDDDVHITSLLVAAREFCEDFQRRCYGNRELTLVLESLPLAPVELPRSPLVSVEAITIYYEDGTSVIVDTALYGVDVHSEPGRIYLRPDCEWPETPSGTTLRAHSPVVIEFTSGYGDTAVTIPQKVKQAILLLLGHWYLNREDSITGVMITKIPRGASSLLVQDKVY